MPQEPQEPQGPADGPERPAPPWGPPPGQWAAGQQPPSPGAYAPPPRPGPPSPSLYPRPPAAYGYQQQPWGPVPGRGLPPHGQGPRRRGAGALIAGITAAVLLVAAVAVTLVVLRSRSSGDDTTAGAAGPAATASSPAGTTPAAPAVPVPASPAAPSAPSGAAAVAGVSGVWNGTYTCAQGLTRLRLTILPAPAAGGVSATFGFSAHPSNPKVPDGLFAMRGTFTAGVLHLRGEHWIRRPAGYQMVGLTATVDQERPVSLEGTIDDAPGCTRFSVTRSAG